MNGRGNSMREVTVKDFDIIIMHHVILNRSVAVLPYNVSGIGADGFLVSRVDAVKNKYLQGYLYEDRVKRAVNDIVEKAYCINAIENNQKYVCSITYVDGDVCVSLAEHVSDENKAYFKAGRISNSCGGDIVVVDCSDGSFVNTGSW